MYIRHPRVTHAIHANLYPTACDTPRPPPINCFCGTDRLATAATAPTDKPGLLRLHVRVPEANPVPSPVGPAPQPAAVPAAATPAPPTRAWPKLSKPLEQLAAHYPVLIIGSG